LAGIPKQVISRAATILEKLEKNQNKAIPANENSQTLEQLEIFNASNHILIQNLKNINIDSLTPLEALNELQKLKKLID
jgi:DNA mismatch repair protein MutS